MRRVFILICALCLAGLDGAAQRGGAANSVTVADDERAPTPEELRALVDRVIANQHRDDAALDTYERIERRKVRSSGTDQRVSEDKVYRVVPTGPGNAKLVMKENGKPIASEEYLRQLRGWEQTLEITVNPDDPRTKTAYEKLQKKMKDRSELVDSARQAYRASWLGHETQNGRTYLKLKLEPNPQFQPKSRAGEILTHARATIWIDEVSGQLARGEADITRDISFGGGVLGKVYRGGRFVIEQSEVTAGIWLPILYQYDFVGRKLFFGFEIHEVTDVGQYRFVGSPKDALAVAHRDIQSNRAVPADP